MQYCSIELLLAIPKTSCSSKLDKICLNKLGLMVLSLANAVGAGTAIANWTEIATAIATAIVEDSYCRIISIGTFCVWEGIIACKSLLLCSSVARIGVPARSGNGANRRR